MAFSRCVPCLEQYFEEQPQLPLTPFHQLSNLQPEQLASEVATRLYGVTRPRKKTHPLYVRAKEAILAAREAQLVLLDR